MENLLNYIEENYSKQDYNLFYDFYLKLKETYENDFDNKIEFCKSAIEVISPFKLDINVVITTVLLFFVGDDNKYQQLLENNEEAKTLLTSVLKLENIDYTDENAEADSLRAMFVAIAKDIRVIIIKLAQVLINAQNIKRFNSEQAQKLHFEIREIYAPLAARLGLSFIKTKLYDLSMAYYHANQYKKLMKDLSDGVAVRKNAIEKVKTELKCVLTELGIKGDVLGRIKSVYSIYNKMSEKNLGLNQIYDLVALRVMVRSVNDCYAVLGSIHTKYVPLDGKFKDYIAKPKPNGYQSLHTTVFVDELPLEIQIRTYDMHNHAEYGIAAHWLYKEHKNKGNSLDDKLMWIRRIIENKEKISSSELLDELKTDVYSDEIFVQTPQGKIIRLVENSTPIDFAYMVHSEVGNKCVGAKVNGKMAPLTSRLNNGDIVEIITSTNSKGPSRDWLKYCKTSQAKAKINSFFKKEMKEDNIKKGKSILEQGCKVKSVNFHDIFVDKYLFDVYEKYGIKNLNEVYAAVGYGSLTSSQVLNKLIAKYKAENDNKKSENIITITKAESVGEIEGLNDVMIKFAKCCNPVYGDEIVGFVSRGNGVTIHHKNCVSLLQYEADRLMQLRWGVQSENHSYVAGLKILVANTPGVLADISNKVSENKINITYINTEKAKDGNTMINIGLNVKNRDQLNDIANKIKSMTNVLEVMRGVMN